MDANRDVEHCCHIAASSARALVWRRYPTLLGDEVEDLAQDAALRVLLYGTGCAARKGVEAVHEFLRREYGRDGRYRGFMSKAEPAWLDEMCRQAYELATPLAAAVRRAVARSPHRQVLLDYHWRGLTLTEIGREQGVCNQMVHKRLRQAEAAL